MKKKGIIAVLSAIVIAAASFGVYRYLHPTALGLISRMVKNLSKVTSFKGDGTMDYDGSVDISGIEADLGLNLDFDMESLLASGTGHTKGTLGLNAKIPQLELIGMSDLSYDMPMESYQEIEGGNVTSYSSTNGGKWIRSVVDSSELTDENGASGDGDIKPDDKAILGLFEKIMSGEVKAELAEETETVCGKEAYRIDISIAGDLISYVAGIIAETTGGQMQMPEDTDLSQANALLVLHIYKDSKLPAALTVDCTELGNILISNLAREEGVQSSTNRFVFRVEVSEYNTIESLEVPGDIKANAVDSEEAGILDVLIPGM